MATVKVGSKTVNVPEKEIEQNMQMLEISREEAIEMYLDDMGYTENEEQIALDEKAKKVKINHQASAENKADPKEKKPRTVKITDEKQLLFSELCNFLTEKEFNFEILKENKLISVKIGEEILKIDLINQRKPKK